PAPVGRTRRGDVRAAARPVRAGAVGRAPAAVDPGPRPLRDLPPLLDPTGRLARLRLGGQGIARRRPRPGPGRPARPQPVLQLLRHARPAHLLRGRPAAAAGPLSARYAISHGPGSRLGTRLLGD